MHRQSPDRTKFGKCDCTETAVIARRVGSYTRLLTAVLQGLFFAVIRLEI
jgi:hypothetical protein